MLKERNAHLASSPLSVVLPGFTPAAGRKTCTDSGSLQKYLKTAKKKKSISFTMLLQTSAKTGIWTEVLENFSSSSSLPSGT